MDAIHHFRIFQYSVRTLQGVIATVRTLGQAVWKQT
jgi:hypothetical protein